MIVNALCWPWRGAAIIIATVARGGANLKVTLTDLAELRSELELEREHVAVNCCISFVVRPSCVALRSS